MGSRKFSAAIAVVLLVFPAAALAADEAIEEVTTTEITASTPYTDEDVADVMAVLGVSESEARLRLDLERASIGFEPKLIDAFPDTFGGAWLEVDGPPGLTVALTSGTEEALPTIQSLFALPEYVSTVSVDHSLGELLALQEQMIAERNALQSGDIPFAVTGIAATFGNYDLDIDVKRSVVVVRLPELTQELSDAFAEVYGTGMLVVEGNGSAPEACTRTDCRYTLRGGLRVNDPLGCSSAFSAVSGGSYYLLSAAHCGGPDVGDPRFHGGQQYGYVANQVMSGRVDAEKHFRPSTTWYMSASIFVTPTDMRPVRYHITWDSTMQGTLVGKAGYVTNTTRGDITSKFGAPSGVPSSNRFLVADYCANPGDSGSAVFNTNTAYGIHHGGPVNSSGQSRVCGDPLDFGYFGNVVYAAQALGVSILAAP